MASIDGFGELARDLEEFAGAIDDIADDLPEGMQGAYDETSEKISREATRRAPHGETGELKGSIRADTGGDLSATVVVGAPHGPLVEYGNGPGYIRPTTAEYMVFTYKGEKQFRKKVESYEGRSYLRDSIRRSKSYFNRSLASHVRLLYERHLN